LFNIYLYGSVITMAAAFLLAQPDHVWIKVIAAGAAGLLWPVLVIGGIELLAVRGLFARWEHRAAAKVDATAEERYEHLLAS